VTPPAELHLHIKIGRRASLASLQSKLVTTPAGLFPRPVLLMVADRAITVQSLLVPLVIQGGRTDVAFEPELNRSF
jgi:hypothetical protein